MSFLKNNAMLKTMTEIRFKKAKTKKNLITETIVKIFKHVKIM